MLLRSDAEARPAHRPGPGSSVESPTLLQPRHALSLQSRTIRGQPRRAPLDLHRAMPDLRAASLTALL